MRAADSRRHRRRALARPVRAPARTAEGETWTLFLLSLSGIVTVGPLLLFGMGAKRLRLSTMGVLQYIAPTMLFVEGVVWFGEPLNPWRLTAFVMIWGALVDLHGGRRRTFPCDRLDPPDSALPHDPHGG